MTVRDICLQAGLTERYFYESFKNSEKLFEALYNQQIALLEAQVLTAFSDAVAEQKIPVIDLASQYEEMGGMLTEKIQQSPWCLVELEDQVPQRPQPPVPPISSDEWVVLGFKKRT